MKNLSRMTYRVGGMMVHFITQTQILLRAKCLSLDSRRKMGLSHVMSYGKSPQKQEMGIRCIDPGL